MHLQLAAVGIAGSGVPLTFTGDELWERSTVIITAESPGIIEVADDWVSVHLEGSPAAESELSEKNFEPGFARDGLVRIFLRGEADLVVCWPETTPPRKLSVTAGPEAHGTVDFAPSADVRVVIVRDGSRLSLSHVNHIDRLDVTPPDNHASITFDAGETETVTVGDLRRCNVTLIGAGTLDVRRIAPGSDNVFDEFFGIPYAGPKPQRPDIIDAETRRNRGLATRISALAARIAAIKQPSTSREAPTTLKLISERPYTVDERSPKLNLSPG